jgi:cytochrome bd ubiquinol oxidase subunit I
LEIPHGLSLLAFHDPNATVKGLDDFPSADWPNVLAIHISFQLMVGLGSLLSAVALLGAYLNWKRNPITAHRLFLWLLVLCGPLGFVALEAGWFVTELGRQPWIVVGILRTKDAVTEFPHLELPFVLVSALYCVLGCIVVWLLAAHVIANPINRRADAV